MLGQTSSSSPAHLFIDPIVPLTLPSDRANINTSQDNTAALAFRPVAPTPDQIKSIQTCAESQTVRASILRLHTLSAMS